MSTYDLTPQIRGLLAAVFIQALKDAKKDGYEGEQARQWLIDCGSEISRSLYGFDIDGLYLLDLLDQGSLDPILKYKPQRYRRAAHRTDRYTCPHLPEFLCGPILICN